MMIEQESAWSAEAFFIANLTFGENQTLTFCEPCFSCASAPRLFHAQEAFKFSRL